MDATDYIKEFGLENIMSEESTASLQGFIDEMGIVHPKLLVMFAAICEDAMAKRFQNELARALEDKGASVEIVFTSDKRKLN